MVLFCLPETLRCLVGNGDVYASRTRWFEVPHLRQRPLVDGSKFPRPPKPTPGALFRPLKYPPHLIVSINGALLFAGLYAMFITFPDVWANRYSFTNREVGYAYLSPSEQCTLCLLTPRNPIPKTDGLVKSRYITSGRFSCYRSTI